MALPMAMRFRHLRSTSREAVGVYRFVHMPRAIYIFHLIYTFLLPYISFRSPIHGRGLFCKRDISAGEMIIEYAGEIIRCILTDKREQEYESKVCTV